MATLRTTTCSDSRSILGVVVVAVAATALALQAQAPPRPETLETILALDPRWTVEFDTAPAAPAGFDQQSGYLPLKNGQLVAIELNHGRVQWQVALDILSSPATGDGLVFAAGERLVTALDQRTGETEWRLPLDTPLAGPLHWDSGWLFASTEGGDVLAVHGQEGRLLWKVAAGSPLAVEPSVSGDQVYGALRDGRIISLAVETGALAWTLPLNEEVTGLLALDRQLLVGTRADRLHSVSLSRGRVAWTQRAGADVAGRPAADDEYIYFVAFDNIVRALDRGSGNLQWRQNLPSRPAGGPLRVDNVLLVPLVTTDIGAFDAQTGKPAFTIRAVGELGGVPFLRETSQPTSPRLIAFSREGALQGFAARFEPPTVRLSALPGVPIKDGG